MKIDVLTFGKAFSPRIMSKVIKTFDKATIIIVIVSWSGAFFLMLFALYTVNLSVKAKREVVEAAATEPGLPHMTTRPAESAEMKPILERLQKRFSDISFSLERNQSLTVSATDGAKFRTWLTVLSYIDTISPQYRWQLKEFCVGVQCSSSIPMRAILVAEKIAFSAPEDRSK